MKDDETVDQFSNKLNGIASKAVNLGTTFDDATLVRKLLDAVPEKFFHLAAAMEQYADLDVMTFEDAIGRLKAFEERLKGRELKSDTQGKLLFNRMEFGGKQKQFDRQSTSSNRGRGNGKMNYQARGNGRGRGRVRGRGRGTNLNMNDDRRRNTDKSKIQCFKCDKFGHYASECSEQNQQQNEMNFADVREDETTVLLAACNPEAIFLNEEKVLPNRYTSEDSVWYLDNGASNHMTGMKEFFSELNEQTVGQVRFGDGSQVEIKGKGSIILNCKDDEQRIINGVYYIPSLHCNILSLGQSTEVGCKVVMEGNFLRMYDKERKLLMKVPRSQNRLYKIKLNVGRPVCLHMSMDEEAWRWHARMGHVNFDSLNKLATQRMAMGIPSIKHPTKLCDSCLVGKQSRQPFPNETSY